MGGEEVGGYVCFIFHLIYCLYGKRKLTNRLVC